MADNLVDLLQAQGRRPARGGASCAQARRTEGVVADSANGMEPLDVLYEADGLPAYDLPDELRTLYGGPLGFTEPRVVANFVSTLDGIVAIPGVARSNRLIRAGSDADRFVMGLLRACADVVLIGSGTLHGSPRTLWIPERAFPSASPAFSELRRRRGQPPDPGLAVITGSGSLDCDHPALEAGALVLTTDAGAERLRGRLPAPSELVALGSGTSVDPRDAVAALRERGHRLVLSEAGPRVFGAMLAAGLVDELFLTSSPVIVGRPQGDTRLGLAEDADALGSARLELRSLRREGDHVLLRYEVNPRAEELRDPSL